MINIDDNRTSNLTIYQAQIPQLKQKLDKLILNTNESKIINIYDIYHLSIIRDMVDSYENSLEKINKLDEETRSNIINSLEALIVELIMLDKTDPEFLNEECSRIEHVFNQNIMDLNSEVTLEKPKTLELVIPPSKSVNKTESKEKTA